ncbi:MAG: NAD(P)-dependent oxidoreductase [Anaerolineales bacterium]|nr:MAG: NAD(P)-dependent oxidoreductase [Anaerolineales bacterium]
MKVIVFGGSGFVGSHLADALTEAGHEVTIFDINPSPYLKESQRFIQGDILDADAVKRAVDGNDVIYNFAGLADIDDALARPIDTVRLNVLGCVNMLEAARHTGVKRFVFASTIYVYSEAGGFYRVSKQSCEAYIEEYQRRFGLNYTILRYGTLYGRRADSRNSVYRYLKQALYERKISIRATGDEMREYIHVEDASRASMQILDSEFENQNVILTGQHPTRFRDLMYMIREMVGSDVQIDLQPPEDGKTGGHYNLTPYTFHPKIGKKLVSHYYLDMGQGLLDCLDEIYHAEQGGNDE